ncbi:hypothetical protein [Aquimarina sp. RZ0]|uniref:hypothetical protein n=1 Tax=Aquimarina sp. RZ0 TaxID=2607730 RepID=UPI0011F1F1D7|nr:hypothetical protein [Aquimarina sp. RZ0]KAA1245572.1 hypothetical protein F0000_11525 [Aquimarina sp. RZ0]
MENSDLQNDGNSFADIIWEVEGETDNDGTITEQNNGGEDVYEFIPAPINRPNQTGNGSRQPNTPIIRFITKNFAYSSFLFPFYFV